MPALQASPREETDERGTNEGMWVGIVAAIIAGVTLLACLCLRICPPKSPNPDTSTDEPNTGKFREAMRGTTQGLCRWFQRLAQRHAPQPRPTPLVTSPDTGLPQEQQTPLPVVPPPALTSPRTPSRQFVTLPVLQYSAGGFAIASHADDPQLPQSLGSAAAAMQLETLQPPENAQPQSSSSPPPSYEMRDMSGALQQSSVVPTGEGSSTDHQL